MSDKFETTVSTCYRCGEKMTIHHNDDLCFLKDKDARIAALEDVVRQLVKAGDVENLPKDDVDEPYCMFCEYHKRFEAHETSCRFFEARAVLEGK